MQQVYATSISEENIPTNYDEHNESAVALSCSTKLYTLKFLNFRTPENFAVIYLKFKQRGQTLGYLVKKMQME